MTAGGAPVTRGDMNRRESETKVTMNPVESMVCLVLSTPYSELKKITKDDFSGAISIDYDKLEAIFKEDRGLTPFEFIQREKLHRAAFLLEQDREVSILELGGLLGFDNVQDFETGFVGYFLIKPGRYQAIRNHTYRNYEK